MDGWRLSFDTGGHERAGVAATCSVSASKAADDTTPAAAAGARFTRRSCSMGSSPAILAGASLDEPMDDLRRTEILVDGEGPGKYLLQIFCKDFATIYDNPNGGPFFLEIIQRKGDRGFGGGNFRALFESIEREQVATGRV